MKICPACNREVREEVRSCPSCGQLLPSSTIRPGGSQGFYVSRKPASSSKRILKLLSLGLAGGLLITGIFWSVHSRSSWKGVGGVLPEVTEARPELTTSYDGKSDFDLTIQLTGDPLGVSSNSSEFIIGNRVDPWGFLRLTNVGGEYQIEKLPVTEPTYHQKVGFSAITWNGTNYVGYADGSFFQSSSKNVFTIHDPNTLQVIRQYPAPEQIGCLAWDGAGYWAATRRNTADSGEPAFLYRLDSNLNVTNKLEPPDIGCQGLAWDGTNLWFADVFSSNIYTLAVEEDQTRLIHTYNTRYSYLSGIAFDGKDIWITEYDRKQLHRLNPVMHTLWAQGNLKIDNYGEAQEALKQSTAEIPAEQAPPEAAANPPKTSDSYKGMASPPYPSDDASVIEFSGEVHDNTIFGSWDIYFGEDFFSNNPPSQESGMISMPIFARYRITVSGGTLSQPIVLQYEADPGENVRDHEQLAAGLGPGKYDVELFIHVQYVNREGTNKILNNSIPSLDLENQ